MMCAKKLDYCTNRTLLCTVLCSARNMAWMPFELRELKHGHLEKGSIVQETEKSINIINGRTLGSKNLEFFGRFYTVADVCMAQHR